MYHGCSFILGAWAICINCVIDSMTLSTVSSLDRILSYRVHLGLFFHHYTVLYIQYTQYF